MCHSENGQRKMGRAQVVLELPPPVGVASFCLPLRSQNMTKLLSLQLFSKSRHAFRCTVFQIQKEIKILQHLSKKINEVVSTPMCNDQSHKSQRISRAVSQFSGCFWMFLVSYGGFLKWRSPQNHPMFTFSHGNKQS